MVSIELTCHIEPSSSVRIEPSLVFDCNQCPFSQLAYAVLMLNIKHNDNVMISFNDIIIFPYISKACSAEKIERERVVFPMQQLVINLLQI